MNLKVSGRIYAGFGLVVLLLLALAGLSITTLGSSKERIDKYAAVSDNAQRVLSINGNFANIRRSVILFADSADAKALEQINKILDSRVRPGLAGDGGGLEVISFDGQTLEISYHGACGSCPSSTTGTLHFIESLLQAEVSPSIRVISW